MKKFFLLIGAVLFISSCAKKEVEPVMFLASENMIQEFKDCGAIGRENFSLVWVDEFDYEGEPDQTKWGYDSPSAGIYNNELQTYTKSRENSNVENGVLKITAKKDKNGNWTSARIFTSQKAPFKYGYFEIRAKLPKGKGTWPAIWMMPQTSYYGNWPRSGEIDIMEHVGHENNIIHTSIHTNAYNHRKGTQKTHFQTVETATDSFHTYAVEWTEKGIFWYVDDQPFYCFANDQEGKSMTWPFDKKFFIILNLAIGGDWGGQQGVDAKLKNPSMEVDYVRVYQ